MKLSRLKRMLESNQDLYDHLKQTILLVNKNSSLLSSQTSSIHRQYRHLCEHLHSLHDKYLAEQQRGSNAADQLHRLMHVIDVNKQTQQRLTHEKEKIVLFLLSKQHLILLTNAQVKVLETTRRKRQAANQRLHNAIQYTRGKVLCERQRVKPLRTSLALDLSELILRLRAELLECRRRTNEYQHRLQQRTRSRNRPATLRHGRIRLTSLRKSTGSSLR